jgi:hypothetical protein
MTNKTKIPETSTDPAATRAHRDKVKKLGEWTTRRSFDARGPGASIVLDLLLPRIEPGDIDVALDMERSTVKLLVPHGARIDNGDLRRVGRSKVKDWTGVAETGGRRIRLLGELRRSEVRVVRGGAAIWALWLSGRRRDVRRAHDQDWI